MGPCPGLNCLQRLSACNKVTTSGEGIRSKALILIPGLISQVPAVHSRWGLRVIACQSCHKQFDQDRELLIETPLPPWGNFVHYDYLKLH